MSTRIGITSDMTSDPSVPHTYELYADCFDTGKVFLFLPGGEFTATHRGVAVAIPVGVWDKIRVHGAEKAAGYWGDDEAPQPIDGRLYVHDSECCRFIGSGAVETFGKPTDYDFYFCPSSGSIVARYGHEGSSYTSFGEGFHYPDSIINLTPVYAEAYRRAVEAGTSWMARRYLKGVASERSTRTLGYDLRCQGYRHAPRNDGGRRTQPARHAEHDGGHGRQRVPRVCKLSSGDGVRARAARSQCLPARLEPRAGQLPAVLLGLPTSSQGRSQIGLRRLL